MSEPDLFVVCKNCSSEVSPYVTECPYCGQRVRKRAPKIDKEAPGAPPKRRVRKPSLPRLRHGEIPGIAPDTRPYATFALILASLVATLVAASNALADLREESLFEMGAIYGAIADEWWRLAATPFLHDNLGYQFVALVAVGIFGMHLERRFGWLAPIAIFLLAGAAGAGLSDALEVYPVLGANGAALGLLSAWVVDDWMSSRRGHDRDNDLIGVAVFAAVLLLLSLAEDDASIAAAAGGAVAGSVLGFVLTSFRRG